MSPATFVPVPKADSVPRSGSVPVPASSGPVVPRPLPRRRASRTTSFAISDARGSLIASTGADGQVAEIFLNLGKQGSTLAGMADAFAIVTSLALQHGTPLPLIVERLRGHRFEPAGLTDDTEIPETTSVIDYVARRLERDHLRTGAI